MKINDQTGIVYSAHLGTKKENIGDILSAKAITVLANFNQNRRYCLPGEVGLSANRPVIYGGGGMLRPLFGEKEYRDFALRDKRQPYAIYGVGINVDARGQEFSQNDMVALKKWILNAQSVTVRDKASYDFVLDKFNLSVNLAPCPSYSVLKRYDKFFSKTKFKLGIVPSLGHTETYVYYLNDIILLISSLIIRIGASNICFICHDEQDYDSVYELFSQAGVSIIRPLTFDQINLAYRACDSIFTLRGHGVVFAAATGRPCSYVPLNVKLNSLYAYHYGGEYREANFNTDYHLAKLRERQLPFNLNINFSL